MQNQQNSYYTMNQSLLFCNRTKEGGVPRITIQCNMLSQSHTKLLVVKAKSQQSNFDKPTSHEQKTSLLSDDKGKGKIDETSSQETIPPKRDCIASSSKIFESTQPKTPSQPRKKVYQPKYPYAKAQKRQVKQVIVPKVLLEEQWLSKVDTYKWVERQPVKPRHSSGWISTQSCLDAQGYNDGNQTLWLPKPELIVQKIPSITELA